MVFLFALLLVQLFPPSAAAQAASPSWQWEAAWFAIGATIAGALATLYAQHRNRVLGIMPKITFFRDPNQRAWVMQNFGQGTASDITFVELDANNIPKHYISLNPLARDRQVWFLDRQFRHCITLVAKYSDSNGRRYFSICNGETIRHPKKDPHPEGNTIRVVPESEFQMAILRTEPSDEMRPEREGSVAQMPFISQTPETTIENAIQITVPRPGEILSDPRPLGAGFSYLVRGRLRYLPEGHTIWLLTETDQSAQFRPQGFDDVVFDGKTGEWYGRINGGGTSPLQIFAVVAPPTSDELFRYYQRAGNENKKFVPLKSLPAECRNTHSVRARLPQS